jgi:hypothetical protein
VNGSVNCEYSEGSFIYLESLEWVIRGLLRLGVFNNDSLIVLGAGDDIEVLHSLNRVESVHNDDIQNWPFMTFKLLVDILPVEFAVFWVKVEVPDFNGFIVGTW